MEEKPKDKASFLASLSDEQQDYYSLIEEAGKVVEAVLAKNPQYDKDDLYHIAIVCRLPINERLARGLRRRKFGYDPDSNKE